MKFTRSKLADVVIIELDIHGDERGYFAEGFVQSFLTMEEGSIISYKVNNYYSLLDGRGIALK